MEVTVAQYIWENDNNSKIVQIAHAWEDTRFVTSRKFCILFGFREIQHKLASFITVFV